jgi:hypothetical protein
MKQLTATIVIAVGLSLIVYSYATERVGLAWLAFLYLLVDFFVSRFKNDCMCNALRIFLVIQAVAVYSFFAFLKTDPSMVFVENALNSGSKFIKNNIVKFPDSSQIVQSGSKLIINSIGSIPDSKLIEASSKFVRSRMSQISGSALLGGSKHRENEYIYPASVQIKGNYINADSLALINRVLLVSNLPPVDFPDLKYRSSEEVRSQHYRIFSELPVDGFLKDFKNPCWGSRSHKSTFTCLPYAYILGQPKCGTSDLFERLKAHHSIRYCISSVILKQYRMFNVKIQYFLLSLYFAF